MKNDKITYQVHTKDNENFLVIVTKKCKEQILQLNKEEWKNLKADLEYQKTINDKKDARRKNKLVRRIKNISIGVTIVALTIGGTAIYTHFNPEELNSQKSAILSFEINEDNILTYENQIKKYVTFQMNKDEYGQYREKWNNKLVEIELTDRSDLKKITELYLELIDMVEMDTGIVFKHYQSYSLDFGPNSFDEEDKPMTM